MNHYQHAILVFILLLTYNNGLQSSLISKMQLTHSKISPVFAPSRLVVDEKGEKWRICAGVALLNSQSQLLVGKQIGRSSNCWQCPQGGVNDAWNGKEAESIDEAACRALYEETGLLSNRHALRLQIPPSNPVRYRTKGTANWIEKAGFAGQELHWTLFRLVDARGDLNPSIICDLDGKGDEAAEFSHVKWQNIDDFISHVEHKKRENYDSLKRLIEENNVVKDWNDQISALDFSGKWIRNPCLSSNLTEALVFRGLQLEEAQKEVRKPYIQFWKRKTSDKKLWAVTSFESDGATPRRELEYKIGEWEEEYEGRTVVFGTGELNPTVLKRRTMFVAEPDGCPIQIAHATVTECPRGVEESRRYLKNGNLVLRRTLWPRDVSSKKTFSSTEVFIRDTNI
mmetsp:Transcript_11707/g.17989  ORF Transcript_11707/g.17989 Transcript_11707/m.17989 type:complete len:398 (+) Transcript_11707:89-1282(+)